MRKEIVLYPPASDEELRGLGEDRPLLIRQILWNRGHRSAEGVRLFLDSDYVPPINPFEYKGMERTVKRLIDAVDKQEKVVVYGDYDADGIQATVILYQALKRIGAEVDFYVPERKEGYGLNSETLQRLIEPPEEDPDELRAYGLKPTKGARVIITVDCGIRGVEQVHYANKLGVDIIVTDHHDCGPELPDAYAIVNPKQKGCAGNANICGAAIAFLVALGMLEYYADRHPEAASGPPPYTIEEWLPYVATATAADAMNVSDPLNRAFIRGGINVLNNPHARPLPFKALMSSARVNYAVDAGTLMYTLGPRINAAGRMGKLSQIFGLFLAEDKETAAAFADSVEDLNNKRKLLTQETLSKGDVLENEWVVSCLYDESDFPAGVAHGIIGIIAGNLLEDYNLPAVVGVQNGEMTTCSIRSIPQVNIIEIIESVLGDMDNARYGGHAAAAGMTVPNDEIGSVLESINKDIETLMDHRPIPNIQIDLSIGIDDITPDMAEAIKTIEPIGVGNPAPLLASKYVYVERKEWFGREKQHLKLYLRRTEGASIQAIKFYHPKDEQIGDMVNVVYEIGERLYGGVNSLQLLIQYMESIFFLDWFNLKHALPNRTYATGNVRIDKSMMEDGDMNCDIEGVRVRYPQYNKAPLKDGARANIVYRITNEREVILEDLIVL